MSKGNQQNRKAKLKEIAASIRGVDLFCGAGGLTKGLEAAGIDVRLGVDIDPACEYPYTANNKASFLLKSVEGITAADFSEIFDGARFKLLAGCAPCQPFSTYSRVWSCSSDERWNLLGHFSRLVRETRPHLVTMENVPPLEHEGVFSDFVAVLENEGFEVFHGVANCSDYGVPQQRQRLVLLASKLGSIGLIGPTTPEGRRVTVRKAIGDMPSLEAGGVYEDDPLHQACELSPLNLKRIRASVPGGTWRDWDKNLRAKCHRKASGKTYSSVYGRMTWDAPSPTMTTQYYGFGNGRFGHPEQDRAISLREGAILQSFPKTYKFVPKDEPIHRKTIGRLIGNAVPVKLGNAIGKSIVRHVEDWLESQERAA
jgi:DNA (cytosine-5)-methyltransferase 1